MDDMHRHLIGAEDSIPEPVQPTGVEQRDLTIVQPYSLVPRWAAKAALLAVVATPTLAADSASTYDLAQPPAVTVSVVETPIVTPQPDFWAQVAEQQKEQAVMRAAAQAKQAELAKEQAIAAGPDKLIDPTELADRQFVGAITIDYVGDRTSPAIAATLAADNALYAAYYHRIGQPRPPMVQHFAHRLVASVGDSIPNDLLSEGAVIDKTSSDGLMVIAGHNITPMDAPVEVDGQTYNQNQMFANAEEVPGDILTLVVPSPQFNGYVDEYKYVNTGSFIIDSNNQSQINSMFAPPAGQTQPMVRTYKCWQPGDVRYRMVQNWELQSTATVLGSVSPVGTVGVTNSQQ